jgi:hypothetical protein
MGPLLSSRNMRLKQLPEIIHLPVELDAAMNALTTKGLQQNPSVEANAVICFDGKFSLKNKALGSSNSSTTDHKGVNGVGAYHSHPRNSIIDAGDFMKMLGVDRKTENFSLVDGSAGKRSALFKTVDSPTILTADINKAVVKQSGMGLHDAIVEIARCAFMGYYEGRGLVLYRVYPKS